MPANAEPTTIDYILIADDEADVHAVTKLTLKALKRPMHRLEFLSASSGREAVEVLAKHPDVAVILLDVVMENDQAGLNACRAIRETNRVVRILLRTGQPGAAPEKQTIDNFDIDGYLPKSELTSAKLYSAVRTALRAHDHLLELDRHRKLLTAIHDCVMTLHSYAPLETTLKKVLDTAAAIASSPLAVLQLETIEETGDTKRYFLYASSDPNQEAAGVQAEEVRSRVVRAGATHPFHEPTLIEGGLVVPLEVHRELGHGFLYVQGAPDALVREALPVLAGHAANALYSSVAETILRAKQGPVFDSIDV